MKILVFLFVFLVAWCEVAAHVQKEKNGLWGMFDNSAGQLGNDCNGTTWGSHDTQPTASLWNVSSSPVKLISAGDDESLIVVMKNDETIDGSMETTWEHHVLEQGFHMPPDVIRDRIISIGETQYAFATIQNVTHIDQGIFHSLIADSNGDCYARGRNIAGEHGTGSTRSSKVLVKMVFPEPIHVVRVSAGWSTSIVVSKDGRVFGVGDNFNGVLCVGTRHPTLQPVQAKGLDGKKVIDAQTSMLVTQILTEEGEVYSCGSDFYGQIGRDAEFDDQYRALLPEKMHGLDESIVQMSVGGFHTLLLSNEGRVFGIGKANMGELGDVQSATFDNQNMSVIQPFHILGLENEFIVRVAAGNDFSVMLDENGLVYLSGSNTYMGLNSPTPQLMLFHEIIKEISAGAHHILFLLDDNRVYGVGKNEKQQLGDGSSWDQSIPVEMTERVEKKLVSVEAGGSHTLVLDSDGLVYSFGSNLQGQLGLNESYERACMPTPLHGLPRITQIAAGLDFSLLLASDGKVFAFGSNEYGQLCIGSKDSSKSPVQVNINTPIRRIAAGYYHTLMTTREGKVWSCGRNEDGQLGDGTIEERTSPVEMIGLPGIEIIMADASDKHSVLLSNRGRVYAVGGNFFGQLGDNTEEDHRMPVLIRALFGQHIIHVAAGLGVTIMIGHDGTVFTTGNVAFDNNGFPDKIKRPERLPVYVSDAEVVDSVVPWNIGKLHFGAFTSRQGVAKIIRAKLSNEGEALLLDEHGMVYLKDRNSFEAPKVDHFCDIFGECQVMNDVALGISLPSHFYLETVYPHCPRGTYLNEKVCESGSAGFFTNGFEELSCEPGYYSYLGSPECYPCPVGTQLPRFTGASFSECEKCVPGTYTDSIGTDRCLLCPPGTYADAEGTVNCTLCPVGTFNDDSGRRTIASCTSCSRGFYCDEQGLENAKPCPKGTFNPSVGAEDIADCQQCPPGFVCGLATDHPTLSCPSGQQAVLDQCETCSAGSKCIDGVPFECPYGTYSLPGASSCSVCPGGFHCPPGTPSATANPSPPGYFSPEGNPSPPISCPPGFYSGSSAEYCTPCAQGSFSDQNASLSCQPCEVRGNCPVGSPLDAHSYATNDFTTKIDDSDLPSPNDRVYTLAANIGWSVLLFIGIIITVIFFFLELMCRRFWKHSVLTQFDLLKAKHFVPKGGKMGPNPNIVGGIFSLWALIATVIAWCLLIVSFWTHSLTYTEGVRPLSTSSFGDRIHMDLLFTVHIFGATNFVFSGIEESTGFSSSEFGHPFQPVEHSFNGTHTVSTWRCSNCVFGASMMRLRLNVQGQSPLRVARLLFHGSTLHNGVRKPIYTEMQWNYEDNQLMFEDGARSSVSTLVVRRDHDTFLTSSDAFWGAFFSGYKTRFQFYGWQFQGSTERVEPLQSRRDYRHGFDWHIVLSPTSLEVVSFYSTTISTLISQLSAFHVVIFASVAAIMVMIEKYFHKYFVPVRDIAIAARAFVRKKRSKLLVEMDDVGDGFDDVDKVALEQQKKEQNFMVDDFSAKVKEVVAKELEKWKQQNNLQGSMNGANSFNSSSKPPPENNEPSASVEDVDDSIDHVGSPPTIEDRSTFQNGELNNQSPKAD